MARRRIQVAALGAMLALVAVACGDDDDDTGSSAVTESQPGASSEPPASTADTTDTTDTSDPTGESDPSELLETVAGDPLVGPEGSGLTRGVSDDSIVIGCVIQAGAYAGAGDGYRARFERANAAGGVHGRRIELLECEDDALDESQNLQIVRRQVEQDEAFAVLSLTAQLGNATSDFLAANEVPYLGWGFRTNFCGHRWGFGLNGCLVGEGAPDLVPHTVIQGNYADAIIAAAGLEPSEVRFAIQAGDDEAGRVSNAGFVSVLESRGAETVYAEADMPLQGVTDYSPYVQATLEGDPNVIFVSTAFENVGGYTAALQAAGYEGVIMNFVAYVPGLLEASPQLAAALEGSYVNTQIVPQEAQTPYILELEDDLEAAGAENGRTMTFGVALAYLEADILVEMLEAVGPDLDTATFDATINGGGFRYEPTEGGPGAVQFPEHHFLPTDCAAIVQIVEGAFEPVLPFACYESVPAG